MQQPDGNLIPMSVNIQVSSDVIQVVIRSPNGTVDADNVVFANGVLNYSVNVGGNSYPMQVKMRQDGNIDLTVDLGSGQIVPSIGSRG